MDRTAWIVVGLCLIALVGWEWWIAKQTPPRPTPVSSTATPVPTVAQPEVNPAPAATIALATPSATPSPAATIPPAEVKIERLVNADVELDLTNAGGGIAKATLRSHKAEGDTPVVLNVQSAIPIGAIVENPEAPEVQKFDVARMEDAIAFGYKMPQAVTVRKKFLLPKTNDKDNFIAELDVDLVNEGSAPYANTGYYVALGTAAPIHPKDYSYYTRMVWCINGSAKGTDVNWFAESSGFLGMNPRPARPFYKESVKDAEWVAVSDQFFTTLIVPLNSKADGVWGRRIDIDPAQKTYAIEGALHMPALQIPPGQTHTEKFEIYVGPKIYHRLARLDHNEAEVMDFGIFKIVSQFLLNFMNLLHGFLWHSYAAAILALTTVIRLVLWPLQSKANRSMRQTAALAPKMQELREKYKDDPTRMNQEVMKLYKEYGINPVGGCLPMMIQIPIFFGLYKMLSQAVELRNAQFLWAHDLSQPDTVAHLPVIGWPINPIPLCMAATQIWLMQMTPKTGDPTQRRIMMFTPLIFLFICYNFAAALALYYTTQNLFSILQFYLNKKQPMPTLEKVAVAKRKQNR
jgi:YidC/Oxa1 family membrane protein insertase